MALKNTLVFDIYACTVKDQSNVYQQSIWEHLNLGFVLFPFIYDGEVTDLKL